MGFYSEFTRIGCTLCLRVHLSISLNIQKLFYLKEVRYIRVFFTFSEKVEKNYIEDCHAVQKFGGVTIAFVYLKFSNEMSHLKIKTLLLTLGLISECPSPSGYTT